MNMHALLRHSARYAKSPRSLTSHIGIVNACSSLAASSRSPRIRSSARISSSTRPFSSSISRSSPESSSSPSSSFADPDRPELFYHLYHSPSSGPVFALSFLEKAPSSVDSCAVIGWLPAQAPGGEGEAGLNDFKENEKFIKVLHDAIESGLRDGVDEIQINGAIQTQQGWMHIHDNRNIPALGRIGDPDDIIASVRVEEGKMLPETYQPMPSYRLCTSDGVMQLTEGLFARLKETLQERVQAENS